MTTWYVGIPAVFWVNLGRAVVREGSFEEVRPGSFELEVVPKTLGREVGPVDVLSVVFASVVEGCWEAFVLFESSPAADGWGESCVVAWGVCDVVVVAAAAPLPAALTSWPVKRNANMNVSSDADPSCRLRLPSRKISGCILILSNRVYDAPEFDA
jgi:hypothetical protein